MYHYFATALFAGTIATVLVSGIAFVPTPRRLRRCPTLKGLP